MPNMSPKYILHDAHELNQHVHFVLSQDPYVGRRDLQYELSGMDVLLKGNVQSYYQKQMAQESLRRIQGIGQILNELTVIRNLTAASNGGFASTRTGADSGFVGN